MALLKEDGSLDVERIRKLPLEEKMNEIFHLNKEQKEEYWSKIPINESHDTPIIIAGVYNMNERGVDALEFINLMRQKYEHRR